jgi:EAL domain-containing protein (putative c-di-GMP-specific phosphodiesterase class I)
VDTAASLPGIESLAENPHIPKDLWISVIFQSAFHASLHGQGYCEILRETDLNPNCLMLELTEGSMLENPEAAQRARTPRHRNRIGLDDLAPVFIAGLFAPASFGLVKIDHSFVRSIESNPTLGDNPDIDVPHSIGIACHCGRIENPRWTAPLPQLPVDSFVFQPLPASKPSPCC